MPSNDLFPLFFLLFCYSFLFLLCSCALTEDDGKCRSGDNKFTFIGQVGIVTAVDNDAAIPKVWATFNGGRTSYRFDQQDVQLETRSKSQYEIWWVVRSPSFFTVQKKKAFNITTPACTFDLTNNRFLFLIFFSSCFLIIF
jgi:hypothetical protein